MEEYIKRIEELIAEIREATTPPNGQGSAETALAVHKLQEGRMWLQEEMRLRAQQGGQ